MKNGDEIGPYRIIRLLGQGGMGSVYEVEHRDLGVRYALKAFTCERSSNGFLRKRFLTEGKLLARLHHPRIVQVFDLAVDSGLGVPYFVMNLVLSPDGGPRTLEDLRKSGGVTEELALRWYTDLAEGLSYVHDNGVVHRDVKLENVLVDAEGHAVLSDFGVSRIFEERLRKDLRTTVTMVGIPGVDDRLIMGTKVYLAPEIRFGEKATPPSDWYALGVLMLRLLTGVWYGPDTDVDGLLAGFEVDWRSRLKPLLAIDPARRRPFLPRRGVRVRNAGRFVGIRRPVWLWGGSAAVAIAGLCVLGYVGFFDKDVSEEAVAADERTERRQEPAVATTMMASDGDLPAEGNAGPVPVAPNHALAQVDSPVATNLTEEPSALVWSGSTSIPKYAFAGRSGLQAVAIPEGVASIGEGAFAGTGLRSVVLPSTLESIDRLAFSACDKLEMVSFKGPPPEVDAVTQTFPIGADGVYPAEWASQWQRVIDPDTGMWMGLLMYQDGLRDER